MILLVDNYDSFTYNLFQLFQAGATELLQEVVVVRNDAIDLNAAQLTQLRAIIISPGLGTPKECGRSGHLIERFAGQLPILGVCLGHQLIAEIFGARVSPNNKPQHGSTSTINHGGSGLFAGLPNRFQAMRYHSLIVERDGFPKCLKIDAWDDTGTIMGLSHQDLPIFGLQFHPESFMSEHGADIVQTFLKYLK